MNKLITSVKVEIKFINKTMCFSLFFHFIHFTYPQNLGTETKQTQSFTPSSPLPPKQIRL
jgi:hypothetical protein